MRDSGYSEEVIEHFTNPRRCGRMPDADGKGMAVAPGCGDTVWIYIKVKDQHISDIRFQAYGCPCAIACASMLMDLALDRHVDEAAEILDEHMAEALNLPEDKRECSAVAPTALHEAIYGYVFGTGERKTRSGREGRYQQAGNV